MCDKREDCGIYVKKPYTLTYNTRLQQKSKYGKEYERFTQPPTPMLQRQGRSGREVVEGKEKLMTCQRGHRSEVKRLIRKFILHTSNSSSLATSLSKKKLMSSSSKAFWLALP